MKLLLLIVGIVLFLVGAVLALVGGTFPTLSHMFVILLFGLAAFAGSFLPIP